MPIVNSLRAVRAAKGLSQEDLARRIGISRRAYLAIESGQSVPATDTALRLAAVLNMPVEALFTLEQGAVRLVEAEMTGGPQAPGVRVRLAKVGNRLLAHPLTGQSATQHLLAPADGAVTRVAPEGGKAWVEVFDPRELERSTLVMAGCDPAIGLLEEALRQQGVKLLSYEMGSLDALGALGRGEAHVAGCHLRDSLTGSYNRPWVERLVPFPCTLVRFAQWREGLVVGHGNPKHISGPEDLSRPEVRVVNRQPGSGSRALLDHLLGQKGITEGQVRGYDTVVRGHLALALAVSMGFADAGVAVEAAAAPFGLGFVPVDEEPYDLVIPDHFLDLSQVQGLLGVLRRPDLRRRLSALGGYDTVETGLPAA